MNCSNCQNPIQQGEKFCGKCGVIFNPSSQNGATGVDVIKQKIKTRNAIFLALLALDIPLMFASGFFFDDPNHIPYAIIMALAVWTYPLVLIFANIFSRKNNSLRITLLPLINIIIFLGLIVFGSVVDFVPWISDWKKDAAIFNDSSRDFLCEDGNFVTIHDKDNDQIVYHRKDGPGEYYQQVMGKWDKNEANTIRITDPMSYFNTCLNQDGKNILDLYRTKSMIRSRTGSKLLEGESVLKDFIAALDAGNRKAAIALLAQNEKLASFINEASIAELRTLANDFSRGFIIEDTTDYKIYETDIIDSQGNERMSKFKLLKKDSQWRIEMK